MCSSNYCFSFAPLIFSIFGVSLFFFELLTFSLYFFFYFSFTKEHTRSNHRKYELKQVKGMACEKKSEDVLKLE
jgi:hypothetical protein